MNELCSPSSSGFLGGERLFISHQRPRLLPSNLLIPPRAAPLRLSSRRRWKRISSSTSCVDRVILTTRKTLIRLSPTSSDPPSIYSALNQLRTSSASWTRLCSRGQFGLDKHCTTHTVWCPMINRRLQLVTVKMRTEHQVSNK